MTEFLEQEHGYNKNLADNEEEVNNEIRKLCFKVFKEEYYKTVEYLNSELAKKRFFKDPLNTGKDWDKKKNGIIDKLAGVQLEFDETPTMGTSILFAAQYQPVRNIISIKLCALKKDEYTISKNSYHYKSTIKYTEDQLHTILYHELLHATGLYNEYDYDLNSLGFEIQALKRNIESDSFDADSDFDRAYLTDVNEIYPRLKIVQNYLLSQYKAISNEDLYNFFRNIWLYNSYPNVKKPEVLEIKKSIDDNHIQLLYDTFVRGFNMNFEEKNKEIEVKRLDRLIELLDRLVLIDDDKNVLKFIG